jgi:Flp pilus assembly protein TadG
VPIRRSEPASLDKRSPAQAARWPGLRDDRGSITLMLTILFVVLIGFAGIVIDGGAKLRAAENANSIAQEAARAAAGTVNRSAAYSTGTFTVGQSQAIAAARAYLASVGDPGTVTADGANSIRVAVTVTEPTAVLSIIGIKTMSSTGVATADLVTGVTGPGQ